MVYTIIHLTDDIKIVLSLTSIGLELEYKEINTEFIETLEDNLSGHPVPSTADSTVPNSAHKPSVQFSDTCQENHSYLSKIVAVTGVFLTVGLGV